VCGHQALTKEFVMTMPRAQRALPRDPSLENLKKQARALLKQVHRRAPEALARLHAQRKRNEPHTLSDAQFVLAREHGFESWPKLKAYVAAAAQPEPERWAILPLMKLRSQVLAPYSTLVLDAEQADNAAALRAALATNGRAFCVLEGEQVGAVAALSSKTAASGRKATVELCWTSNARLVRNIDAGDCPRAELTPLPPPALSKLDVDSSCERLFSRLARLSRSDAWLSKTELDGLRAERDLARLIGVAGRCCKPAVAQALLEIEGSLALVDRLSDALDDLVQGAEPTALGSAPAATGSAAACIVVLAAPGHPHAVGKRTFLDRRVTTIGRAASAVILLHGDAVSREHASIEREGEHFVLVDGGSTNSTFISGQVEPVARRVLADGDRILVGDAILLFSSGPELETRYAAALDEITRHDAVSGALTARSWLGETERLVLRARGHGAPLSVVLLRFARPRASDLAAQRALPAIVATLRAELDSDALLGRTATDEFALALPSVDRVRAQALAERLVAVFAAAPPAAGVATLYETTGADELLDDARAALTPGS
jgi:GGDEF domain-containing protein